MQVKQTEMHRRKKTGAFVGAGIMVVLMAGTIALILWANSQEPIPAGLLLALVLIPVVIVLCIIVALIERMKEIEGGEEDEASKY